MMSCRVMLERFKIAALVNGSFFAVLTIAILVTYIEMQGVAFWADKLGYTTSRWIDLLFTAGIETLNFIVLLKTIFDPFYNRFVKDYIDREP